MPGEFFEDRELERGLVDEFPTPPADVFDDLTFERAPRAQLAKLIDLFRLCVRLLAFYALAATAEEELPAAALERVRKLLRQALSDGDWISVARETVRPFARTPHPFPLTEVAAVFFVPGTEQPAPGAAALERLLQIRNQWAHGVAGSDAEVEAVVEQCRPHLEALVGQLQWLTRAPWFVAESPGTAAPDGLVMEGRRLVGTTPRRGFRPVEVTLEESLEPGMVYALGPAGPLALGPLVQYTVPAASEEETAERRDEDPELFFLEAGGRHEARLQAFPSGHEVSSREAQEWLTRRADVTEETREEGPRFDVPMVDRRADCELFQRLLARSVEERQGQVLIIEGEAGIGKTKFFQFCREVAAPRGVRVMRGAYRDHAGGAYAGFREALEDLFGVEMLERAAASARIDARLPELGYGEHPEEAADLATFLTQLLRPIPGAGEEGREGLDYVMGRMERFLRRASLHGPLLLLLEDLHWADAESVALLQHLAAVLTTDPSRLLIAATMRAEDREPNSALESALQKMARFEGTVYRRRFSRLDEKDTTTLIAESLQAELEDREAVYRLAGGNPLHVLSILRYLYSEELLETTQTGLRVKQGVQLSEILPTTVREVIRLRVQRLVTRDEEGEARREALAWAAVAGWRFDVEVLREAIQAGAPHLSARLDVLLDAFEKGGLLHGCPSLPGDVLQFDHHLLREVVLAEQEGPRAERARHRCLAAAKLRRVQRGDRSLLPEVAHHYLEAREWTEAVRYQKLAGDAARDSLAFLEASCFYETAVRLLKEHPDPALTTDERAGLYEAQAEVLETLGHLDEALAAHRAAQTETEGDRVRWARNERCIAWFLCVQGQLDEAAEAGERALEVLEAADAGVDLADALRTLGYVEICRGHSDAAAERLQRALEIYQRSSDRAGLARCYGTLAILYRDRGDLPAMLEAANHARAIWQELGSPVYLGRALNNAAWCLLHAGRDEEALPLLFHAVEILERHHVDRVLPNVYHSLAEALLKCGRGGEAASYLERGLESARRVGEVRTVADFHCLLARQAAGAGRFPDARTQYEQAVQVCADAGLEPQKAQILLESGDLLLRAGDPEEALRVCEEALAIRRRLGGDGVAEAEAAVARAREADPAVGGRR